MTMNMTPEQINEIIHRVVMRRSESEPCDAIVMLRGRCVDGMFLFSSWHCPSCGAGGDYNAQNAMGIFTHARRAPNYYGELPVALEVMKHIVEQWPDEMRQVFSAYCFGSELYLKYIWDPAIPLVDVVYGKLAPERICYAALYTMCEMQARRSSHAAR